MGLAYVTLRNHSRLERLVVGAFVFLLVFTGFVSQCEAYPAMVCCQIQVGAERTNQHHQDTQAASGHEHHVVPCGHLVSVDAKSDSPSCCDALGCETCRSYFTGHMNGLVSVLTDSAPLQDHLSFGSPPSRLPNVTSIPEPHPPKCSHA